MKHKILLSCEHASNHIPRELKHYFPDKSILKTHRAYDIGAGYISSYLAERLHMACLQADVSRLVVDLNRSLHHPNLHSEFTRVAPDKDKSNIISAYYLPYRHTIMKKIESALKSCDRVIHISVHSFTPVMNDITRNTDIGLLYDPSRKHEKILALAWKKELHALNSSMRVRFNYPYKGISDGLTTFLRKKFSASRYAGIELEMNQSLLTDSHKRKMMANWIAQSLERIK